MPEDTPLDEADLGGKNVSATTKHVCGKEFTLQNSSQPNKGRKTNGYHGSFLKGEL